MDIYRKTSIWINSLKGIPASVTELYFLIRRFLPKNPVILEAGAHMGYDTFGLAKIWPAGKVYAFEPVPHLYIDLEERVKGLKNVSLYNLALGEKNCSIQMFVSSGKSTASSSILKPSKHLELFPSVMFDQKVNVEMKTLNHWIKKEKISEVDLMWLDLQGYEINALQGASDFIKNVSVIYTELCTSELYEGLTTKDDYISFLNDLGFTLIGLSGVGEVSEGVFVNLDKVNKRKMIN